MKKVNKVRGKKEKVAMLVKNSRVLILYPKQLFISEKRRKSSTVRFKVGENSLFLLYDFNPTGSAFVAYIL